MEELNGCEPRKITTKGERCNQKTADFRPIYFFHRQHHRLECIQIWRSFHTSEDAKDTSLCE